MFNLGHRHPAVVAAVRDALDHLDIGNHHLVSGWRAALAERLAASTGGLLPGVVFGVGGGEANDLALKLARAHTGRPGVISAVGGYHGHTGLALATGDPEYRDPFGPNLPGFAQVPFDDLAALDRGRRRRPRRGDPRTDPRHARHADPRRPATCRGAQRICRERGACLVLDEVQTGLGRTGTMWYFHQEDVEPDIVITGKGLSGGIYPITATLMTAETPRVLRRPPVRAHLDLRRRRARVRRRPRRPRRDRGARVPRAGARAGRARFEAGFAGLAFELRRRGLFMGLKFADAQATG